MTSTFPTNNKKVAFYTLGCKLNFAESSSMAQRFKEVGYTITDFNQNADLYIINTCTVTKEAEKKCRRLIQRVHRLAPLAKIAIMGCFSELRAEEINSIKGVTYVFGTQNREQLFEKILADDSASTTPQDFAPEQENGDYSNVGSTLKPIYSALGRTRSFFKIQDGCDNFCTYCAIPYARGHSRSCSIAEVVSTAEEIAKNGFKEVVFTGVNIGDFGRKNEESFYALLQKLILIKGIERWRISSVEPDLLSSEIIKLVSENNSLMPHFHIPLQAGSDSILKQMKRRYDTEFFRQKVEEIKKLIPNAFIAADVIVGFPTESALEFEQTYSFIESLPISALHVFTYSPRPEAFAYNLESCNSKEEREERSKRLHQLSYRKKEAFYKSFEFDTQTVLWESEKYEDKMLGYTENYLRVIAPYKEEKINTLSKLTLGKAYYEKNKEWLITADNIL